ncbi:MAG: disulfide bond formation protein B [bacterium]|nr:disulfide bond formation protein B [bacterium]
MIDSVNFILSVFAVIAQIAIVFLIVAKITKNQSILKFVNEKVLILSLVIVLGGIFGSLFYSEIAGYAPCSLCWWQRVFLYPQAIILGLALIKKDLAVTRYIKTLSLFGLVISAYQSLLQMGLVPSIICGTSSISCAQRYFINFGYITLPLMGFTAFLLLTILNWNPALED